MGLAQSLQEFAVEVKLAFDEKKVAAARESVAKLGEQMRSLALDGAGMAASIFAFGNAASANARSLQDQADTLGIGTEALQEYEYAAKVAADVNRDDLVSSLQHVNDMMDRARAGDQDARQTLLQLAQAGIGTDKMLENLSNKSYKATDAMKDLSLGMKNIYKNSPAAAGRLAEAAFGSAKLMPLLKDGPEAISKLTEESKKNFVINQQQIAQAAEMDKEMSKIWLLFRKLGYEIGFTVLKYLKPMIQQFQVWFGANKKLIGSGITEFLKVFAEVLKTVFSLVADGIGLFKWWTDNFMSVSNSVKLLIGAFLAFKAISIGAGLFSAFTALQPILEILLPAMVEFGIAAAAMLAPVLAWAAAIGAVVVAVHDLVSIISDLHDGKGLGEALKGTWTGKAVGAIGDKMSTFSPDAAKAYGVTGNPGSGGMAVGGGMAAPIEQHNTFNQNIQVPTGTSPSTAANIITKSSTDTHEKMMIKAKQDATRKRIY